MCISLGADETVQHLLAAGMLEVDLELVTFDGGDRPVAELAVEHALAEREVVAALVAEADGRRACFNDPLRFGIEAAAAGPLPARPSRRSAHRLGRTEVRERVCPFRPLGAPQALAAGHGCLFDEVALGQLGNEARRDRAGPLAVDAAV